MSGFKPSVIASVVLGLMTRMERFVGAILVIAAGVPKCFKWALGGLGIADGYSECEKRKGLLRLSSHVGEANFWLM